MIRLHARIFLTPGFTSLLAGACTALAFAPFEWAPLAVLGLAWLFHLWAQTDARGALRLGWSFGCGLFLAGVYWVFVSMHTHGHIPWPFAALLTFLFAAFLALFPALAGWLANRFGPDTAALRLWLAYPALWVWLEWIRSWFFTGFPWLNIGISQVQWPLAGYAPIGGEYLVSWLAALSATALAGLRHSRRPAAIAGVLVLGLAWFAGSLLDRQAWTEAGDKPLRVALVQGNVEQFQKWDPEYRAQILAGYRKLSEPHWGQVDVMVWPETAIPAFYHRVEEEVATLQVLARSTGTDLLAGIVYLDPERRYYNSMISISEARRFYHKRHLVPFGEYIPLQRYLSSLLDIMGLPMSGFTEGEDYQPALYAAGFGAGITVCYEIIFNSEVIHVLPAAHFLVNVSNNTWFGDTAMPFQILQMGRMRARETERYVLSVTNNGITAIVDHTGAVQALAPQFVATVLTGTLQARSGATPFVVWGNVPVLVVTGLLAVLSLAVPPLRRRLRT